MHGTWAFTPGFQLDYRRWPNGCCGVRVPRTLVSFRCLLANGHSQASSVPDVVFIEFDAITVQKVARLFLESSRHMAPEFHALIFPSPSEGMGAVGCADRGLAADGSHFAESQAFFNGRCRFSLPIAQNGAIHPRCKTERRTERSHPPAEQKTERSHPPAEQNGAIHSGSVPFQAR